MLRGLLSFSSMTMISRVLGLVRDQAISITFGANATTDAFWVAFRVPNFLRRLFAEGSFATAFVPVFTEVKETRPHADLRELMARVSGTLGGVLLVLTALGLIFTPQIAWLFADADAADPVKYGLLVDLLRLTFPFLLFVSLTALAGGALNSFQKFAMPALTPVILNLCMIAGALWLAPRLEVPILALGWAVLAAGVLQLLFQLPSLKGIDLLTLPRWGWNHPDVRRVLTLMVPTLFGSSVAQINLMLDTVIAARLSDGSQSWLSLADRFLELPLGVFGVALGTVILPALARHHVKTDGEGFSNALDWGLRMTLLIAVPAMLGLLLLAQPLIATLFQYREFTDFDTRMTALSVYGLSFGLPAFALLKVVLPAFYSRQDTKTPVRAGVAALVANMVFNFILLAVLYQVMVPEALKAQGVMAALAAQPGLHLALGIASALSSYLNLALLWYWLGRTGVYRRRPGWGGYVLRLVLACMAMSAVLLALLHWLPGFGGMDKWQRIGGLALLVGGGGLTYLLAMLAMGFRPRDLRGQ
ncbi:MAG: murein biosynthesis integral membrane protein MurJ [Lysobacteraceae bacterium SCN 69-123]|jgi:putative peptidoglycan lipid II flippase|uniref:murein biosynthesis integral membrane protein MurJ n=1 Tax=Stenotrophomonas acidaminiphila TaxID=128780 RepID=UPI00086EE798|nr:murein biosynthesis integral membrane protein MurJ [Stenotrophomonas acidaminiphila]MBN8800667.1 murein biosynthesis integral membrane protein MurJ [Stenotrophomonas acidaminiphila]MDF9440744.1 murein biosynthesis integral membrane protein MurJ [Stenotrophomonas acidaminiphila]ODU47314.1 MAG: murein biosynthesis integral membrane protein MurJ [Xanthomonadaceae bacterium SCN 69-123]OJY79983.1 MAG: murein biosynthesis integral membrane protein MurJ [Stenotrophomonas sp. 69-14]